MPEPKANRTLCLGTKLVYLSPMTRGEYNAYRGWNQPKEENPSDPGYFVEYLDGGAPNHAAHSGYVSWTPASVADGTYQAAGNWDFGQALTMLKRGHKLQRKGWNGKGMFVVYMEAFKLPPFNTQGTARKVNDRTAKWIGEDTPLDCQPYIAMFTADKKWQPGWLASQPDMLAEDWQLAD